MFLFIFLLLEKLDEKEYNIYRGVNFMTWEEFIENESKKDYYIALNKFIKKEYETTVIYPKYDDIFKAFKLTPLENVKVVIIGQDPYQTPGYACGLAFSVNPNVKTPKSLQNIYKELHNDTGLPIPNSGDLTNWAKNGILLLNRILTVESYNSLSHQYVGWEEFTDEAIKLIEKCDRKIVYILLGNEAKSIKPLITNPLHLIIEAPHPSPLSAYRGFFGSKIFSRTCEYLDLPIDFWRL